MVRFSQNLFFRREDESDDFPLNLDDLLHEPDIEINVALGLDAAVRWVWHGCRR